MYDVLNNLQCKRLPKETNITELLDDISHKELIQKPKFIIVCWLKHLLFKIDLNTLQDIYDKCIPNPRKVIDILEYDEGSLENSKITGFLKKYIKEISASQLSAFLRFVMGADIITMDTKIFLTFNDKTGLQRMPIGRTCGSVLELSVHYDNYPDFRSDMNCVLKSDVWVMDLI